MSSRQIWEELQSEKYYTHTLGELAALRKMGMVQSRPIQPERGKVSELGWYLLKRGANTAGIPEYWNTGRLYSSREAIAQRGLELELARQVSEAGGWNLVKPIFYNSSRQLPPVTPQGKIIQNYLKKAELAALRQAATTDPFRPGLSQKILNYRAGFFEERIPYQVNDYVAYRTCGEGSAEINMVVILILCPAQATKKYWQSRISIYSKIVKSEEPEIETKVEVLAVFKNIEQANVFGPRIQAAGLTIVMVNQVKRYLQDLLTGMPG